MPVFTRPRGSRKAILESFEIALNEANASASDSPFDFPEAGASVPLLDIFRAGADVPVCNIADHCFGAAQAMGAGAGFADSATLSPVLGGS